jgi:hypothetical protein
LGGLGTKVTGRFLFFDLEVSVPWNRKII